MFWLKQSTAVTVKIGPFVDDSDGNTAEGSLTLSQADIRLSKNGGNIAQKNDATSCTHDELGVYGCPLDATDTATLGRLQLFVHESGSLPVWHEFMVVPANVYDSLISGSDVLQADVIEISGDDGAADNLELDYDGTGYNRANSTLGTVSALTGHTAQTGDNYARLGAPAGASIAADIGAIPDVVWDEAKAGHTDPGSMGEEIQSHAQPGDAMDLIAVAIDASKIAGDSINANKIADDAFSSEHFATDAIAADALAADAVTEIQSGLATAAALAAQNDISESEVNAQVVDVLRTDTIPDSYSTDGNQPTIAQAILQIHQIMTERSVAGTTVTIKKPDGSTTAMTFTLDDGATPTSISRTT